MLLFFSLLAVVWSSSAFPEFELCLLDTWIGGQLFNQFGIVNYTSGGNANCVLEGVPRFYNPCETFVLNLTSTQVLGHKVAVSAGTLSPGLTFTLKETPYCRHSFHNVQTLSSYRWTAPSDNTQSVLFGGLCGDMTTNSIMFAADYIVAENSNKDSQQFTDGCPLDEFAAEDTQPPNASEDIQNNTPLLAGIGGGVVGGIGLVGLLALRQRKATDKTVSEKVGTIGQTVKRGVNNVRASIQQSRPGGERAAFVQMTAGSPSAAAPNQNFAEQSNSDSYLKAASSQQQNAYGLGGSNFTQQQYQQQQYNGSNFQNQGAQYTSQQQYQQSGYGQRQNYLTQQNYQQPAVGNQHGQRYQNYANYNNQYGLTASNPAFKQ